MISASLSDLVSRFSTERSGQPLAALRQLSGLSQFSVAQMAGVSRTRVSLAENGELFLTQSEESAVRCVLVEAISERQKQLTDALLQEAQARNSGPIFSDGKSGREQ